MEGQMSQFIASQGDFISIFDKSSAHLQTVTFRAIFRVNIRGSDNRRDKVELFL